jgi:transposase
MLAHHIPEDYSTKTCSHCGHVRESQQRGRRFVCEACGARLHRDVNGAANICSRALHATYGLTQIAHVRHVRPIVTGRRRAWAAM